MNSMDQVEMWLAAVFASLLVAVSINHDDTKIGILLGAGLLMHPMLFSLFSVINGGEKAMDFIGVLLVAVVSGMVYSFYTNENPRKIVKNDIGLLVLASMVSGVLYMFSEEATRLVFGWIVVVPLVALGMHLGTIIRRGKTTQEDTTTDMLARAAAGIILTSLFAIASKKLLAEETTVDEDWLANF